ncbi:MAG: hypothetical protein ABIP28_06095 [Mucilaginibacter sp.]
MKKLLATSMVILFLFVGCKRKFNKVNWLVKEDIDYPYRDAMLDDLIKSHKLVGLSYKQVIQLLGKPQSSGYTGIYYQIKADYGADIDPIFSKILVIEFGKDSIATTAEVKEWKK